MSEAHRRRLDAVERRIGVDGTCEWGGEKHGPSWCHVVMLMIHWGGIAAHEAICPQLIDGKHMVAPYEPVHWQFTDESRRKVRWNGIPQPSGRTNNCATCRLRPGVVLDLPEWANAEWLEVGMLSPCADGPERWALDGAREDRLVASQLYRDRAAPPRDGAPVARSWRTTAASVY